jgi:hypothetical protein
LSSAPLAPAEPDARAPRWLLVLVLALAAALRLIDAGDPFGVRGFKSAFGNHATGAPVRTLAEHGILECGLLPSNWRIELADGSVQSDWYLHHPAGYMIASALSVETLGPSPFALRLPALLGAAFALWAVCLLLRELAGERAALAGLTLFAAVPFAAWYGTQPWTEGTIVGTNAMLARSWCRWLRAGEPRGRRRALGAACGWVAAGGLLDWPAHFLVVGLGLHALTLLVGGSQSLRQLLPALGLPAVALATIALHRLHLAVVVPADALAGDALLTLERVTALPRPLAEFAALQARYQVRHLTPGGLALGLLGIAALARGAPFVRPQALVKPLVPSLALVAALLLPGALYIALFPGRSDNHDFFGMLSLPGWALGWAFAWRALAGGANAGRARRAAAVLAFALAAAHGTWRTLEIWAVNRSDAVAASAAAPPLAQALGDPRAVVLASPGAGTLFGYSSSAALVHTVDSVDELERLRRELLARLEPERRAWFLLDLAFAQASPQLRERLLELGAPIPVLDRAAEGLTLELYELPRPR